jgi:hypothetical protein
MKNTLVIDAGKWPNGVNVTLAVEIGNGFEKNQGPSIEIKTSGDDAVDFNVLLGALGTLVGIGVSAKAVVAPSSIIEYCRLANLPSPMLNNWGVNNTTSSILIETRK